jgi:hypothetical protein
MINENGAMIIIAREPLFFSYHVDSSKWIMIQSIHSFMDTVLVLCTLLNTS